MLTTYKQFFPILSIYVLNIIPKFESLVNYQYFEVSIFTIFTILIFDFYVIKISDNQGLPQPAPRKHQVKMVKIESRHKLKSNYRFKKKSALKFPKFCVWKMLQVFLSQILSMLVRSWRLTYNTLIGTCIIKIS